MLIQLASVASAEVYTWEDANGINFSDSPPPVHDKYSEKAVYETNAQIDNSTPPDRVGITHQNRSVITHEYQTAAYHADLEQQRRAVATIKQQQTRRLVEGTKGVDDTFPSLACLIVVWIILALFLSIIWILTIVDIVKSYYITPSTKTVWMVLVVFIPLIGMLLYYILGTSQKISSNSFN
jgi:hypothetical protein